MKKLILPLMLLMLTTVAIAQPANKQQLTVQQAIKNMFAALSSADTASLKTFVTAHVRFYEYGQVWTLDTLIQKVMQSSSIPDFKRTNYFEFVSTTINKTTAFTTYYLQSTIFRNGKEELIKWMETVVLIKQKNKWTIDVLHSTRLPKN